MGKHSRRVVILGNSWFNDGYYPGSALLVMDVTISITGRSDVGFRFILKKSYDT